MSLQLLVILQQGVKARPTPIESDSSTGRIVTGKASASVDSALIISHVSDIQNNKI